jgi:RNA recognition motif-containing protein
MENINQLKCRKCGGKHLTIKCGINQKQEEIKKQEEIEKQEEILLNKNQKSFYENNDYKKQNNYNKTTYKIKISNLPNDIDQEELYDLLKDWGTVLKINVKTYYDLTFAIIEFKNKNEQEYFIEALDNTPFGYNIINVTKLEY